MWQSTPLMTWKLWALWCAIRSRAPYLPDAFVQENFNFYGRTLSGTEELRERWKRGVAAVENALDQELGKEYVAVHFPPEHKEKTDLQAGQITCWKHTAAPSRTWIG